MVLLILGIVALVISFGAGKMTPSRETAFLGRPLRLLAVVLLLIGALSSATVQIDAGNIGIQKLFGSVQPGVLHEGLHLINPLVNVVELDGRTQNYTMSSAHDEGAQKGDDAIRVLTADGLEVVIDLSVLYRILPTEAPRLYRQTGPDYEAKNRAYNFAHPASATMRFPTMRWLCTLLNASSFRRASSKTLSATFASVACCWKTCLSETSSFRPQ